MNDADELSLSAVRHKRAQHTPPGRGERPTFASAPLPPKPMPVNGNAEENKSRWFIDPWRFAAALKSRWRWLAIGAAAMAVLAFAAGYFSSNYHARVTLIARNASATAVGSGEGEAFKPREFTPQTLVSLMGSPELAQRVAAKLRPTISGGALRDRTRVEQVRGTELVALTLAGKDRQALVAVANLYANEAVQLGKELQVAESRGLSRFCAEKLIACDAELRQANDEFVKFQTRENLIDPDAERQAYIKQLGDIIARADNLRIEAEMADLQAGALQTELAAQNPVAQKLQAAKNKLADLLTRLTEEHPYVIGQRKEIAQLEKQLAEADPATLSAAKFSENTLAGALYMRLVEVQTKKLTLQRELQELDKLKQSLQSKVTGLSDRSLRYANLKARLDGLQKSRASLAARQREAQLFQSNAQGYYRVFAPATLAGIDSSSRWFAGLLAACVGAVFGVLGAGLVIVAAEIGDGRLKTAADVERVTGLPVLAALADLKKMSAAEQDAWAFRAWTALSGQLNASPNHGMVCGFISSTPGEGCSTWVNLLAKAASQRGLRALTLATSQAAGGSGDGTKENSSQKEDGDAAPQATTETQVLLPVQTKTAGTQMLTLPAQGHIQLPGTVWNLEHRKQWQHALTRWRAEDNVVLLVDLPSASVAEAVLLAETLPQVIWLVDSGKPRARATREQLKTLRHAKCRLVGAVLNHEPKPVFEL